MQCNVMWGVMLLVPSTLLGAQGTSRPTDPYARYTPRSCTRIAMRAEQQYWRDKRRDTVYVAPYGNALRRETVEQLRQCVGRFTIGGIGEGELLSLGFAHLLADQPAQADSAFARAAALSKAPQPMSARAWTLAQIVMLYREATPFRREQAEQYMQQLDDLGPAAAAERLVAHRFLTTAAKQADDVATMAMQAEEAIRAARENRDTVRKQRAEDELGAWLARADIAGRQFVPDSGRAVIRRATMQMASVRPNLVGQIQYRAASYDLVGTVAPRLRATQWFDTAGSSVYPRPGIATLIIFGSPLCGDDCYPGYAILHRLHAKYGSEKLVFVVVATDQGFFRSRIMPFAEEAERTRWYFREYLKLPVVLGIWHQPATVRADGRRMQDFSPNIKAYSGALRGSGLPDFALVDPQGIIRLTGNVTNDEEARIDHVIADMYETPKQEIGNVR